MTSTTTLEIDQYYERVRAALGGLTPEVRDDLLEDLPDHLAEVLAEGDGSLRDRLGEPEDYAAELYAAAGGDGGTTDAIPHRLQVGRARAVELANRFDLRAGRLVGYSRLTDLLRAVRPGWWVLRGWIVAQFVAGHHDGWEIVPRVGGSAVVGFVLLLALIAASVWIGQRSLRFADWPRHLMLIASAIIAVWALVSLTNNVGTTYSYGGPVSDVSPYGDVTGADATDVYVYDRDGNQVVGARLFDQNGNPIHIGSGTCQNGDIAPGTGPDGTAQTWTYPLCPGDPGPFRSGPGPLPATAATPTAPPASSTPPTGTSTPPAATPTATPTVSHATSPQPTR